MFVQRADSSHVRVEAAMEDDLETPRITRQDLPSKEYDVSLYLVQYSDTEAPGPNRPTACFWCAQSTCAHHPIF